MLRIHIKPLLYCTKSQNTMGLNTVIKNSIIQKSYVLSTPLINSYNTLNVFKMKIL